MQEFAQDAYDQALYSPQDNHWTVGTHSVTGWIRVYDQIRDLIAAMQRAGFDVWIVTASPQHVVDAISFEAVGVLPSHVIGIRSVIEDGLLTAHFQGCGTVADGADSLITFDEGKRCWINNVILQLAADQQMVRQTDANLRPVFVAGDSDTDIAMLKDASVLKLVVNRKKTQIMCNALANHGGTWLVQPMFIEPKACRTSPYACTTATDPAGVTIVDETGAAFTMDYADSICMLP